MAYEYPMDSLSLWKMNRILLSVTYNFPISYIDQMKGTPDFPGIDVLEYEYQDIMSVIAGKNAKVKYHGNRR